jgi:hypothetical protein
MSLDNGGFKMTFFRQRRDRSAGEINLNGLTLMFNQPFPFSARHKHNRAPLDVL